MNKTFKEFLCGVVLGILVLIIGFWCMFNGHTYELKVEKYQTFNGTVISVDKDHNVSLKLEGDNGGWYLENTQFLEVNDNVVIVVDTQETEEYSDDVIVDIEKTPIPVDTSDVHLYM